MKPHPKRTNTELGLGRVSADDAPPSATAPAINSTTSRDARGEARRTNTRERISSDDGEEARARAAVEAAAAAKATAAAAAARAAQVAAAAAAAATPAERPATKSAAPPSGRKEPDERRSAPPQSERTPQPYSERFTRSEPPVFSSRAAKTAPSKSAPPARPAPAAKSAPPRTARTSISPSKKQASGPPRTGAGLRGRSLPPPRAARPDPAPPTAGAGAPITDTRRKTIREPVSVDHVDHVGKAVKAPPIAAPSGIAARSVPKIIRSKDEIAAAPIDHRAGFLLAHIDGSTTVQGLVDIAGMSEEEVHSLLERLRRLGIVGFR